MSEQLGPTVENLREIADQVWLSYLDPEGIDPLVEAPPTRPADEVFGTVSVTGAWLGHVVMGFSTNSARHAAAALLGIDADEVGFADITDAVGELANVIGGNVKSVLPEPSALSLPHVLTGSQLTVHWPAAKEVCQLSGVWAGEPVIICILEGTADISGAGS